MVKIATAQLIEISKVKLHPNNVKEHPEKQIKNLMQLIEWVGFKDPIVLDKDYLCRAGHGRLIAAERLGMTEVPFVTLEGLTKKQMDLFIYMDNQINESPWIKENVQLLLKEIPKKDLALFDLNWEGVVDSDIIEDTDPIPEPPKIPKTQLGQIYQLGDHRVICGDATKIDTYKKLLGDTKLAIGFTSPPYNMGKNAKATDPDADSKYKNSDDNMENYKEFLVDFTKNCLEYCHYMLVDIQQLAGNKIDFINYLFEMQAHFVDRIIWDKKQAAPALAKNITNSQFEDILIFAKGEQPSRAITSGNPFHGTVSNVYSARPQKNNDFADVHKATFPIHLPFHFIKNFSKINDSIIDPFGGTGTTLIACEQLDRTCYLIELDPSYVDVIIERWENFTGQKAKLIQ